MYRIDTCTQMFSEFLGVSVAQNVREVSYHSSLQYLTKMCSNIVFLNVRNHNENLGSLTLVIVIY